MEKIKVVKNEDETTSGALGISKERLEEMNSKIDEKIKAKQEEDGFEGYNPSMLIEIVSEFSDTPAELAFNVWNASRIYHESKRKKDILSQLLSQIQ